MKARNGSRRKLRLERRFSYLSSSGSFASSRRTVAAAFSSTVVGEKVGARVGDGIGRGEGGLVGAGVGLVVGANAS